MLAVIYANIYFVKRCYGVEMYIVLPICYEVMNSVLWGYIILVERESHAL